MSATKWLTNLLAPPLTKADFDRTMERLFPEPPLSQSHFDCAMAEQTKVIEEGNAQVVAALQESNAQVVHALSEMTQQMSGLSGDIRGMLESMHRNSGSSGATGDDA